MSTVSENIGHIVTLLFFDFVFFVCVFLYLLYLLLIRYFPGEKNPSPFLNSVNNFYLILTSTTFLVTLVYAFLFPLYFSSSAVILPLIMLVFVYLFYLRFTDTLKYMIILQEMPRLPHILVMLVTLFTLGFLLFQFCVQVQVMWGFSLIPLPENLTPSAFPELKISNQTDSNDPVINTALEDKANGTGFFRRKLEKFTHGVVEKIIDSPTTPEFKEMEKRGLKGLLSKESNLVWPMKSLGVNLETVRRVLCQ